MKWKRKPCGCINATLPVSGKVALRCDKHRGKPAKKRLLSYMEEGIVRAE